MRYVQEAVPSRPLARAVSIPGVTAAEFTSLRDAATFEVRDVVGAAADTYVVTALLEAAGATRC